MEDEERRQAAIKRLKEKRDFWGHVIAYILVNGLLVVIWWVTTDGNSHFWPMWPMLGWGIGLGFHAWDVFQKPISEEAIRKEMDKGHI